MIETLLIQIKTYIKLVEHHNHTQNDLTHIQRGAFSNTKTSEKFKRNEIKEIFNQKSKLRRDTEFEGDYNEMEKVFIQITNEENEDNKNPDDKEDNEDLK